MLADRTDRQQKNEKIRKQIYATFYLGPIMVKTRMRRLISQTFYDHLRKFDIDTLFAPLKYRTLSSKNTIL